MPKVSVIIPCYNAGEWIDEAVDSILAQTYKDYEIIIVNDGSSDPLTQEKLRSYESSSIQVIHQKNKGLAGARNTGIRSARGEYILPLDADDMFAPTYLEKSVSIMERNPSIGVVTCWVKKFGEQKGTIQYPKKVNQWSILISTHTIGTSLFRKACWEEVSGYDEQAPGAEDWEFWIRVLAKGWQRYAIQEPLFRYRIRLESLSRGTGLFGRVICSYIYNKHCKLYNQYFWKSILFIPLALRRNPYLIHPAYRFYPYHIVFACRDNLHPLVYKVLRMVWKCLLPVYKLLLAIRNKIQGRPPAASA